MAPASHESAGKRHPVGTRNGSTWLQHALVEAAGGASRTKGSYLSAQFSRLARRRGSNKGLFGFHRGVMVASRSQLGFPA